MSTLKKTKGRKTPRNDGKRALSRMAWDRDEDASLDMERNFALLSKQATRGADEELMEAEDSSADEDVAVSANDDELDEEDGSDVSDEDEGDDRGTDGEDLEGAVDAKSEDRLQTQEEIKTELSNMSFEDIMKLQNKVGTKAYNDIAYGTTKTTEGNKKKKRLNKNRPMEMSSKKAAPFLRQVVPVKKSILRDPRFDDLSGEYKPEVFEKTYKFINDIRHREKEVVQKKLKKVKQNNPQKEKLEFLLKRMENQERARKRSELQREKELEFKRTQREMAGKGLKPFFLKKSDKKKIQLADKYDELKKSGKLQNFLSKKRKRNATKDRRKLPQQSKTN